MEEKLSYYVVIPMPIYDDETLKDSAKLLYGLISSLINEEGYCFASNEYLAKKRKTTPQNISRLLNELEKKEYIVIIYLRDGAIVKNRKIYINSRLTEMLTVNQNVKTTVNQNVKESNKAIKGSNKYIIKEIYKEKFDNFWELYPNKKSKQETINWFNKSNMTDELYKTIIDKLKIFKKLKTWQDIKFIPHPSTWLNQRRWEDEIDPSELIREPIERPIIEIPDYNWLEDTEEEKENE